MDTASLVASVRTPDGPRHKYICYLGSITRPDDNMWGGRPGEGRQGEEVADLIERHSWYGEEERQRYFWKTALRNLKAAGIAGADLEKIVARLEQAVPRPPDG
jgi:hypothetical protein